MNIYIVCPVRLATEEMTEAIRKYASDLRGLGHHVHFPTDDVDQNDPTGERICREHAQAMLDCDRVDIFWDRTSNGSHFDAGMAFILNRIGRVNINMVYSFHGDIEGKSYEKVLRAASIDMGDWR